MIPELTLIHLVIAALAGIVSVYFGFVRPVRAKLAAAQNQISEAGNLSLKIAELEKKVETLNYELLESAKQTAAVEAELKGEKEKYSLHMEELDKRFKSVAPEILEKSTENILQLMTERFKGDQAQSKAEIEKLVQPIRENLTEFNQQIKELERRRVGAYEQVVQQVKSLAESQTSLKSETARLVQSLRQPKTRGRWGEYQLRNVLEMAGMQEHVDYVEQYKLEGDEQRLIPDVIIRMPGGKSLVIDAKTPLDAYLNLHEATEREIQNKFALQHARQVRNHVRNLSSKSYWDSLESSPDFVVMFIPGEAFYTVAIERDPDLFEYAISQKVLICTPATMVALVKAIAYGWQQEKLAENTQKVAGLGEELHKRLGVFIGHMESLGKVLNQAVNHYNKGVGSLESRVLPTARKFENLGVSPSGRTLQKMNSIEASTRPMLAEEADS